MDDIAALASLAGLLAMSLPLRTRKADPSPHFKIIDTFSYDLLTDVLRLDIDCPDTGRAFAVEWNAENGVMALLPDGKGGKGHWTGLGTDGEPDGCEQSREECPVNEALALNLWLEKSLKDPTHPVAVARQWWIEREYEIRDPR